MTYRIEGRGKVVDWHGTTLCHIFLITVMLGLWLLGKWYIFYTLQPSPSSFRKLGSQSIYLINTDRRELTRGQTLIKDAEEMIHISKDFIVE